MATDIRTRVSKRERELHLSYELPHRIHSSHIYPITAPNGSTVILYGYNSGLRVLWRGGRRRRANSGPQHGQNGTPSTEIVMLDADGDAGEPSSELAETTDEFEIEEEELDPDCPYPSIVQSLDLQTGSDVLQIAIPSVSSATTRPKLLKSSAIVAIASADGSLRLLQIPLKPPANEAKDDMVKEIVRSQVELVSSGAVPTGLSVKLLPVDGEPLAIPRKQTENVEAQILVASSSRTLNIWSISVTSEAVVAEDKTLIRKVSLASPPTRISFHPSPRSTQLLVADRDGAIRLYNPYPSPVSASRPGSSDSTRPTSSRRGFAESGVWVMTYYTPFVTSKDAPSAPMLARRKKLLDARWIMSGTAIITVLEDGQWGIWNTSGSVKPGSSIGDFMYDGFLEAAPSGDAADSTASRRGSSKLAPMTPNSRKARTEQLFVGTSRAPGIVPQGGISICNTPAKSGQMDESIMVWYNSQIYSIPSTLSFWQRSTTNSGTVGSLYAPGLLHITDVYLNNENITSISQFPAMASSAGIGQMNTQRDLLVSGERRMIALHTLRPPTPARALFQVAERPASKGQGQSVLTDIDRALDDMAADSLVSRRVGFAAH